MNFHSGLRYQRGRGLGSLFSGLMRGFAPLARMGLQAGKKLINSDIVKNVGRNVLDHGKKALIGMAADLIEGKNVKENAQAQLNEARKDIANTLRGSGRHRKRRKKCNEKCKTYKKKRFNLLEDDF